MHRDHYLRLEITRHRQPSHLRHLTIRYRADRHQDDVWMIKLLDQRHVAKDPRVALVIDRAAIRKLKHITDRPPARLAAMHCRHHMDFHVARLYDVAHIHSFKQFPRQLALLESLRHGYADKLRLADLRQLDRIAEMIAMGMGY